MFVWLYATMSEALDGVHLRPKNSEHSHDVTDDMASWQVYNMLDSGKFCRCFHISLVVWGSWQ